MPPRDRPSELAATTWGRILLLLRRSERTVTELAAELGISDNAVRGHLAGLERDGLVRQRGVAQRGRGKPAYVYEMAPDAERLFPKAYAAVLYGVLDILLEQRGARAVKSLLREVGTRLAEERTVTGGAHERVEAAVGVLVELGGDAELIESADGFEIRGYRCPFGSVVARHPELCTMAETLLGKLIGSRVREACDRGESPRCRFTVAPAT